MRTHFCEFAIAVVAVFACAASLRAQSENSAQATKSALTRVETWLKTSPNGDGWNQYLGLRALGTKLSKGDHPDQAVVAATLKRLDSGAPGLELAPFRELRAAVAQLRDDLAVSGAADLSAVTLASQGTFDPITAEETAADKAAIQSAAVQLERYLKANGANGAAWRTYLRLSDLQSQLQSSTPDVDALQAIQRQFAADENGLELAIFADVNAALTRYLNDLEAAQVDLQAKYAEELKGLSDELKQLAATYSDETAAAVGTRLAWLNRARQGRALARAIRGRYAQPNLHAQLSERLVGAGIDQEIDEMTPVQDVILGTDISGTGRTIGTLKTDLVPSKSSAMLETLLVGTTSTKTIGVNGPATIWANGTIQIQGRKRIVIDANGLASYPATGNASTKTQITGIGAKRRLVQKIATKRAYQSKAEAEQIGSQHAAARVRSRVEAQAGTQLNKAQGQYVYNFRNPLLRRHAFPELLQFQSTDGHLLLTALAASRDQIAAPLAPPPITVPDQDLWIQAHESLINNLAASVLSGVTWREEEVQKKVIELRGSLPEQLKSEEDRDPWSLTFAAARPVIVKFADNGLQITVRGQRYTSGERAFRAMNVTADYKLQIDGHGSKLVRQGELQIFPPGFVQGQTRLSTQQVTLKTLLQRKFGKIFEPEIKSEGLVLPGRWKEAGRLDLKQLLTKDGWLVAAWVESGEPAPPEKVALRQ